MFCNKNLKINVQICLIKIILISEAIRPKTLLLPYMVGPVVDYLYNGFLVDLYESEETRLMKGK